MKKFLVVTSIFHPTVAMKAFALLKDWQVIVVGDKKTPSNWRLKNVTYLSPEAQAKMGFRIAKFLPWNHYGRKMLGYLYAMRMGAEIIADSDDDNIPKPNWGKVSFGATGPVATAAGFINPYSHFTDEHVWPRGLPLTAVMNPHKINLVNSKVHVTAWQYLADGEPDVDALWRLTLNKSIRFRHHPPFALGKGTAAPMNSQNTFFHREAFAGMYLPSKASFRATDIIRGLILQPILWAANQHIGFGSATVHQERNPHDYHKDFHQEVEIYLNAHRIYDTALKFALPKASILDNLEKVYSKLARQGLVKPRELAIVRAWRRDVESIYKK